jgi:hypothetical protein
MEVMGEGEVMGEWEVLGEEDMNALGGEKDYAARS